MREGSLLRPIHKALLYILSIVLLSGMIDLAYLSVREQAEPIMVLNLLRARPFILAAAYSALLLIGVRLLDLTRVNQQVAKWMLAVGTFTLFLVMFPFSQFTARDLGLLFETQIALQVSPLGLVLHASVLMVVIAGFWLLRPPSASQK